VTYTLLVVVYLLVCAGFGLKRRRGSNTALAAGLALAMVCAQLIVLFRV
jgi:hypothetical protein